MKFFSRLKFALAYNWAHNDVFKVTLEMLWILFKSIVETTVGFIYVLGHMIFVSWWYWAYVYLVRPFYFACMGEKAEEVIKAKRAWQEETKRLREETESMRD